MQVPGKAPSRAGVVVGIAAGLIGCGSELFEAISARAEHSTASSDTASVSVTDAGPAEEDDAVSEEILFRMMGYAAVEGLGHGPTTGGIRDPDPVTVTSAEALQQAIDAKGDGEPLTIYIDRRLTNSESGRVVIRETSDISVLGVGDAAELDGFGISIASSFNIVIRNLRIHHVDRDDGDAVRIVDGSHHIWIDHCNLHNAGPSVEADYDGLIDITHRSDYITVSWNHLHDSRKGLLVGHDDDNRDEDEGSFHITYHHNHIEMIGSGVPSVRFGRVHVWNNYYRDIRALWEDGGIGVSARIGACVRVENNLFLDVHTPVITTQSGSGEATLGQVSLRGNELIGHTELSESPTCELSLPYAYEAALLDADALSSIVPQRAGTGKLSPEGEQ